MKFKLLTAGHFYKDQVMIKKYEKLGFTFRESKYGLTIEGRPEIEINTIAGLMEFIKEHGRVIIEENGIILYDDYME